MANHIFGAGKLFVGPVGNTLDDTNLVAEVQSATFAETFETKEVKTSGWINLWPTDNAQSGAEGKFSAEFADLAEALIPYNTGATKTTSGNVNIYTASRTSGPSYIQIRYEGRTSDGRPVILEIARCKAPGMSLGMKRDDFTMPSLEASVLPDPATTTAPWILRITQPS